LFNDTAQSFLADVCSGTSGHAVWKQTRADGSSRNWILVQLPQQADSEEYESIADIGKERLRRVIKKLKKDKKPSPKEDLGFRVLRLVHSHYRAWKDYQGSDISDVADLFSKAEETLIDGWKPDGLLIEIMLIEGFPLDSRIASLGTFKRNTVVQVTSDNC